MDLDVECQVEKLMDFQILNFKYRCKMWFKSHSHSFEISTQFKQ